MVVADDADVPPPDALFTDLGAWTVESVDQHALYFDTADLRLTRAGVSLRHRSDDGWTVKTPRPRRGAALERTEHRIAGAPGSPPAEAVALVRGWTRRAELVEVAAIRTRRRRLRLFDDHGRAVLEVDDDHVDATATGSDDRSAFHEIEVEAGAACDDRIVATVLRRLRDAGADGRDPCSKVIRVLGARALEPPDVPEPARLGAHATVADLVQRAVTTSVRRLVDQDHVVRLGEDPEGVHQARVATRRLRSNLRAVATLLEPGWADPLRTESQWLGELLGRVRDADVLLGRLEARARDLPDADADTIAELVAQLRAARAIDRLIALDALASPRYSALLDALVDGARVPRVRSDVAELPAVDVVRTLVRPPWRRLRRTVRALPSEPTDAQLHEVRKRAKQLRYALEAVGPVAGKDMRRLARRVAALQDHLGDHHDAVVAAAWLRGAARESADPAVAFAAGELAASFTADARRLRSSWSRLWADVSRRAGRVVR